MPSRRLLPSGPEAAGPLAEFAHRLRRTASATRLLASWCAERDIGDGPIRVERHAVPASAPGAEVITALLGAGGPDGVRHRRVTLRRGGAALSDCDIWWLPSRLDPTMQAELDGTDRPFGLVVEGLHPIRRMLSEAILPPGGPHILEHRALLLAGTGAPRPIAMVRELYRRALIE
ncbi:hypothetical protein GXW74_24965 [Roseomonas eburnea]|uniref:Chorismate lyase n=1 Tax=Neoroseomonas eburnea TaxID=1346889 RepID=A0A9X9XJ66_9PROT|nr:hypothetical protein [Neoroseomonas eburnea]MBR0683752.1 hypothetical protein [Neoroseomonas eburnea]